MESIPSNDDTRRILIVDDNLAIHEDFKRILTPESSKDQFDAEDAAFFGTEVQQDSKLQFELEFASQGQEALDKVRKSIEQKQPFAVVFMDVRMPPGWDGVETTKKIWEADPDLQVVICTAYSDYSWDEMVATLGHTDKLLILRKPFDVIEAEQAAHTFSKKWELQQASRKHSIFLEQTTDLAPSMIFWLLEDGSISYANKSVCSNLGFSQNELRGKAISDVIPEWQGEGWNEISNQLRDQKNLTLQTSLTTHEGISVASELIISSLDFKSSRLICISAQDIRERIQTLNDLASARDSALEAVRMKSQFLATMSHEIRTPMNGVVGMAELLAQTTLNPSQREYVGIINQSGSALLSIINDILDSAKIESGKLDFQKINFSPREVISSAIKTITPNTINNDVELIQDLSPSLPDTLRGDPGRFRQILVNLLGNAVKFTHHGTVTISTDELPKENGRFGLRFSIKDTGIGIDPKSLDRIFQPFTQADNTDSRRYGGTGLGLTITNQIIQAMGGQIHVHSEVDQGTEFIFSIYFDAPTADSPTESQPVRSRKLETRKQASDQSRTPPSKLRILLAEDNPVNRKVTELQLKQLGLRADFAENGAEAVEAFKTNDYDVILMDCQMPVMDGFEATKAIRAHKEKSVHIIAVTANAMKEDRDRCLEAGMDDYLSKPLTTEDLAKALKITIEEIEPPPQTQTEQRVPEAEEPEAVDRQRLKETTDDDPDLRREIIKEYLQQADDIMAELSDTIQSGDISEMRKLAHKLAGSSATCGMAAIVPALQELENLSASDLHQSGHLHQQASAQLERIRNFLAVNYS